MLTKAASLIGASVLSAPIKTRAETWEDYKIYEILQEVKTIPGSFRYVAVTGGGAVLETAGMLTPIFTICRIAQIN